MIINKQELETFTAILKLPKTWIRDHALDRTLRKLTERKQVWPMTDLVEKLLKENNLYPTDGLTKSRVESTLNKKLRKLGCESIYFEHWKEVKEMIKELLSMNLSDDLEIATNQVEEYLVKNTDCFFRLTNTEKRLQPHLHVEDWKDAQYTLTKL